MFAKLTERLMGKPENISSNKTVFNMLLKAIDSEYSWTPDAVHLERKPYQPVFVCCNLAKGGEEYPLIEGMHLDVDEDGRSLTPTAFTKDKYVMWMVNPNRDHRYPVMLKTDAPAATMAIAQSAYDIKSARIKGRLYQIRSDIIYLLDKLRHNGLMFHRQKVDILVPYRVLKGVLLSRAGTFSGQGILSDEFVEKDRAWMYIGDNAYWQTLIDRSPGEWFKPLSLREPTNLRSGVSRLKSKAWDCGPFYSYNPKELIYNSE